MPRVTNAQQALDGGLYSIKLDYSRLALIPEDVADPFFTFDCVLLEKGAYKSDVKFIYKSSAVVRKVPLFTKVVYQDDQEGIVVYCQDTDLVSGGTKSGKYIGVINLPLKARQYKTETDVFYLGEAELKTVKSMSERPATEIPDLEGFVKSFQPYKRMGVKSLDDLDEFRKLDYTERVQRCVEAAAERTNTYCEEHAKGAPGIQAKIRAEREDRLKVHRGRVDSTLARETLAKPFAKRFMHVHRCYRHGSCAPLTVPSLPQRPSRLLTAQRSRLLLNLPLLVRVQPPLPTHRSLPVRLNINRHQPMALPALCLGLASPRLG